MKISVSTDYAGDGRVTFTAAGSFEELEAISKSFDYGRGAIEDEYSESTLDAVSSALSAAAEAPS